MLGFFQTLSTRSPLVVAVVAAVLAVAPRVAWAQASETEAPTPTTSQTQGASESGGATALDPVPEPPRAAGDAITLELIMSDPDWLGRAPEDNPWWADDGQSVYYQRKRHGEDARDIIQVDLEGRVLRVLTPEEKALADTAGGRFDPSHRWKIYERRGDLFLKDTTTGALTQLTRTADYENDARFAVDAPPPAGTEAVRAAEPIAADARPSRILFRRGGAILTRDLVTGQEVQLVDLRMQDEPADPEKEAADAAAKADYLAKQQERLFETIREEKADRLVAAKRRREEERGDPTRLEPWYLGAGQDLREASVSPAGRWLLARVAASHPKRGRNDTMPNYVTEDSFVAMREVRDLVGASEEAGDKLVLLDLAERQHYNLELNALPGITDDVLAPPIAATQPDEGPATAPATQAETQPATKPQTPPVTEPTSQPQTAPEEVTGVAGQALEPSGQGADAPPDAAAPTPPATTPETMPAKPRAIFAGSARWSEDGSQLALQIFSYDNKDRWLAIVDFEKHALVCLHHLRDPAWIEWSFNDFGWLPDGRTLYYLSEESGYSHLYLRSIDEAAPHGLTMGSYEVSNPRATRDGRFIDYTANASHPGVYEVHRIEIATGRAERLTALGGLLDWWLSPDEMRLLIRHSKATRPPELFVQAVEPRGTPAVPLTHAASDAFLRRAWVEPRIVEIPSSYAPGRAIFARLYLPDETTQHASAVRKTSQRPAVLFIHGAGYLQNAHSGWSYYFREFMFHTLLVRRGYVVLDMDYRASAGYGRDWRTAIYRRMGTPELEDLEDGVCWLVEHHDVDPQRVGLYGGSYGGFLTLMALFKRPDHFACGAALRPVTDWAHYNHGYTSNILDTPAVAPEAYETSSPIEFAEGLKDPLLICHGMLDDNVFAKDTIRLSQRLIELEKEDWEVALYPLEAHAFENPSSWLDEYRRILKLFEMHLRRDGGLD